jgi:hypothetical protein
MNAITACTTIMKRKDKKRNFCLASEKMELYPSLNKRGIRIMSATTGIIPSIPRVITPNEISTATIKTENIRKYLFCTNPIYD